MLNLDSDTLLQASNVNGATKGHDLAKRCKEVARRSERGIKEAMLTSAGLPYKRKGVWYTPTADEIATARANLYTLRVAAGIIVPPTVVPDAAPVDTDSPEFRAFLASTDRAFLASTEAPVEPPMVVNAPAE